MSQFALGDHVKVEEGVIAGDGTRRPVTLTGKVVEIIDANALYPGSPKYKPSYAARHKDNPAKVKASKFPAGTAVYRLLIDGEKHPRNFHESQVARA